MGGHKSSQAVVGELADAFARATVSVLEVYLSEPARIGVPTQCLQECGDITIVLGLFPESDGRATLEMSQSAALGICKAMNYGQSAAPTSRSGRATLSEFATMTSRRAAALLGDGGDFSAATPLVLTGVRTSRRGLFEYVRVPVHTEVGVVVVDVSLLRDL